MNDSDTLLTERETAAYLRIHYQTLGTWRRLRRKDCPPYHYIGRSIRYRKSDLDRWIEKKGKA